MFLNDNKTNDLLQQEVQRQVQKELEPMRQEIGRIYKMLEEIVKILNPVKK